MVRKPHKKSRSGCRECKRRHLKCDENRPVCVNCTTAGLPCAFLRAEQSKTASPAVVDSPALSRSSELSVQAGSRDIDGDQRTPSCPPTSPAHPVPFLTATDPALNLDHLELLHHFCTETYKSLTPEPSQQCIWQSTAITMGLNFPFLMHELLAIAALHLAHCKPERASHYYTKATELQSHALKGFNLVQMDVGPSNCGALLIFASLLAVHVLADQSQSQDLSFSGHLDHFLSCLNLMRGVHHLVIADWGQFLSQSELKPLFNVKDPSRPYDLPPECHELADLTDNTELGPATIRAYDAAIERLHWTFAVSSAVSQPHETIRWVLGWPAQLRDNYLELLNKRRPEALIILAYYGVLLHSYRRSWAIGNSGACLVKAINAHTGPYWSRWMAWPNHIIESTDTTP